MKPLVLFSLLVVGLASHSVRAEQQNNTPTATSSATSTVSIIKTETIEFSGLSEILLTQSGDQSSAALGLASMCITSSSNNQTITLSSEKSTRFELTDENSIQTIPYNVFLNSFTDQLIPVNNSEPIHTSRLSPLDNKCKDGEHYQFRMSVPSVQYNQANPGLYTDTIIVTIAAE